MNHCPNCGKEINTGLTHCPYCNFPLPEYENINIPTGNVDMYPQTNPEVSVNKEPQINQVQQVTEQPQVNIQPEPQALVQEETVNQQLPVESVKEKKETKPKKKKRKISIFPIFLILIILGLSGFIVYDKVFNKKTKVKVKTETKEEVQLVTEYLLTDQEALGVGNYLWNYALDTVWCNNFKYSEEETDLGNNLKGFEITNYQDILNNFTEDFTYEYKDKTLKFNDIFENHTLNDKYYDVNKCSQEKDLTYGKTTLKIKSNELASIKFTATSNYCSNLTDNQECNEETTTKTVDKDFEITKEDNTWKINKFVVPN